jgi:hypothetical protein
MFRKIRKARAGYLRLLRQAKFPGHSWWVEEVGVFPRCEIRGCQDEAVVHGRNHEDGRWVYMCYRHYSEVGVGLGPSQGLVLVLSPR